MQSDREIALEEENKRLRLEIGWIHQLMLNKSMQPREKVVLYEAKYEIDRTEENVGGLSHIFVSKVADRVGIGKDSVGDSLRILSENGVIERKIHQGINEQTGKPEKINLLGLTDLALNPRLIRLPETGRGGKRKKGHTFCKACGSYHLILIRQEICMDCGSVNKEGKKLLNEETQPTERPHTEAEIAYHIYTRHLEEGGDLDYQDEIGWIFHHPSEMTDKEIQKFEDYVLKHEHDFMRFIQMKEEGL